MITRPVPLASFASVMGIVGLGLAWRLGAPHSRYMAGSFAQLRA